MEPINSGGDSASFDMSNMGDLGGANDVSADGQTTAASVQMFAPDDYAGDDTQAPSLANTQANSQATPQAAAAAAPGASSGNAGTAAQGADASAKKDASGADKLAEAGKIMDLIKSVISAATELASPILSMITSLAGNAITAGAKTGAGAA